MRECTSQAVHGLPLISVATKYSHLRLLALPYPKEWGGHREDERNRNWAGNCRRTLAPQKERKNGKNFLATFTTFVATKLFLSLSLDPLISGK